MHAGRPAITNCPQGEAFRDCNLQCRYNRFEKGDLRIDSWELKCIDCGYRTTIAQRSDDEEYDPAACNPAECPFCKLVAGGSGKQLCQE